MPKREVIIFQPYSITIILLFTRTRSRLDSFVPRAPACQSMMKFLFPRDTKFSAIIRGEITAIMIMTRLMREQRGKSARFATETSRNRERERGRNHLSTEANYFNYFEPLASSTTVSPERKYIRVSDIYSTFSPLPQKSFNRDAIVAREFTSLLSSPLLSPLRQARSSRVICITPLPPFLRPPPLSRIRPGHPFISPS